MERSQKNVGQEHAEIRVIKQHIDWQSQWMDEAKQSEAKN